MNSILNRLMLWQKFALLGIFCGLLLTAPLVLFVKEANKEIHAAELEVQGIPPIRALLKTVVFVQQHRGMSAIVLSGNDSAEAQRSAKQAEVNKAIEETSEAVKRIGNPGFDQFWQDARNRWTPLAGKVSERGLNAKESFAEHTAIVAMMLKLSDTIIDHYGIELDPGNDTYHLIDAGLMNSPLLMETLGRLRARGSGMLTAKAATLEDRGQIIAFVTKAEEYYESIGSSLDKAIAANPALKDKLAAPMQSAKESGTQILKLAREQIVNQEEFSYAGTDFFAKATEAIGAQLKLYDATIAELDTLLQARSSNLKKTEYLLIATLLALAVTGGLFAWRIVRSITVPLDQAVTYAKRVAAGDLTGQIKVESTNETGQLLQALKEMNESLVRIVSEVRGGTETIATASNEIAVGNMDLSSRTEQQAGSIEETAASMEEITGTVRQNAENAMQANQLAMSASEVAGKGGAMVAHVVQTMGSINESSRKIVDIISVIDGIAFQTNILALNAAVEAARAGEQGRGFAVVASEVRNLAQRSAGAAKEIKELINDSVGKVDAGAKLVDETGATMNEIVSSIKRVSDIIGEITAASREQSSGIDQVNTAIVQMDEMTQQNASLVEEAAAAAEALKDQAQNLAMVVSVFKLDQANATQASQAAQAAQAAIIAAAKPKALPKKNTVVPLAAPKKKIVMS